MFFVGGQKIAFFFSIEFLPLAHKLCAMNMNSFFHAIHAFAYSTFELLPVLGDVANWGFISIMFLIFVYWLRVLAKDAKAGK